MSQWASVGVSKVLFSISKVCLWHNNVMIKFGSEVVVNIFCFIVELLLVFFGSHGGPSLTDDVFGDGDVSKVTSGGSVHSKVWNWVVLRPVLWFVSLWEKILSATRWIADWVGSCSVLVFMFVFVLFHILFIQLYKATVSTWVVFGFISWNCPASFLCFLCLEII